MLQEWDKIKSYLNELGLTISKELPDEGMFMVQDEDNGIKDLIVDIEDPILVIEQYVMEMTKQDREELCLWLLQTNRKLVHGAFVMDEDSEKIYFRDTLQLQSLDLNELEGSIKSLTLAFVEFGDKLIVFSKK